MKVRTGFVSNSSSSSFVAVGFDVGDIDIEKVLEAMGVDETWNKELEEKYGDKEQWLEETLFEQANAMGMSILNGSDDGVGEDEKILCDFIADGDEYETSKTPLSQLEDGFAGLKEIKEKLDIDVELYMYSGIRMC